MIAIFIVGAYLVLASCCITYMFSKVMKERLEKEKLIYTSNTDELTRCLNRHAYENDMKKSCSRAGLSAITRTGIVVSEYHIVNICSHVFHLSSNSAYFQYMPGTMET